MRAFSRSLSAAILAALFVASAPTHSIAQSNDGKNRRVEIHNHSGRVIGWIYASNVGTDDWENDLLGSGKTMSPGDRKQGNIDDGTGYCMYDFKVRFLNGGDSLYKYKVNVCAVSIVDVYGDRIEVQYP